MIRFPLIAKSLALLLTLASSGPASAVWMFPDGTYKLSFQASGFVSQIDGLPRDQTVSGYITFTSDYDAMLDITMPTVIDADVRVEGRLYDESKVLSGFGWPGETLSFGAGGRGHAIDAPDDIWLRFTPRTSLVEFRYVTSAGEDNLASVVTNNFAPVPEPTGGVLTASVLIAAGLVMARRRPALGGNAPTRRFARCYPVVSSGAAAKAYKPSVLPTDMGMCRTLVAGVLSCGPLRGSD